MRASILFSLVAVACCVGCPPSPAPIPPDASDASPPPDTPDAAPTIDAAPPAPDAGSSVCVLACAKLSALGCPEGKAPSCVATCSHVQATNLTDLHASCLASATSKAAARACGSVSCP